MRKVLIIGAGGVGRVVTHKYTQNPKVFSDIWHKDGSFELIRRFNYEDFRDRLS